MMARTFAPYPALPSVLFGCHPCPPTATTSTSVALLGMSIVVCGSEQRITFVTTVLRITEPLPPFGSDVNTTAFAGLCVDESPPPPPPPPPPGIGL
jgi:hypothetical protein